MSEQDRAEIYEALYREIDCIRTTVDRPIYEANEMDLLVRVNGLTEAVFQGVLHLMNAKMLLRDYIDALRAPPAPAEEPTVEGEIKF